MQILYDASTKEVIVEIGKRMKALRIAREISQAEMAERAGVSHRTITNLETGKDVAFSTVINVLRVLGKITSLEEVIPEQGPRPSDIVALGKMRERAPRNRNKKSADKKGWVWGDEK